MKLSSNKKGIKSKISSSPIVKLLLLTITLFYSCSALAYRLKDDDVVVVNGIITQCTYDINSLGNIIEIPETLDGQTITGLGDYCFSLAGKIKEVTMPSTLKTIGQAVFQNHNLTQVILPEGITTIGGWAFDGNSIEIVNLPSSLTSIGNRAFRNNQIKAILIPEGLTVIDIEVFAYNKIEELNIPQNIITINGGAFNSNLIKNLLVPNTLSFVGESAFSWNGLESLSFEEGCKLTSIKFNSFSSNKLVQVILPNSIKVIDNYAFATNNLTSVIFNQGLQKIGKGAFYDCKLTAVDLPDGLIYIGSKAFVGNSLSSIKLPNQNMGEKWTVSDGTFLNNGELFTNFDLSYIVRIPYTLQDDDVEVNSGSIIRCSYTNNIENIGNAITIPETLDGQEIVSISTYAFDFDQIAEINFPPTLNAIYNGAFSSCEINNLIIPASVKILDEYCFSENNIGSITFETGSKLKIIDNYAFAFNKLKNLQIPRNVSRIGRFAFSQNKISSVIFEQPSQLTTIESDAFNHNNSLFDFTLPEPVIAGYEYQGWIDGNGVIHKASQNNLTVNDFSTYYRVLLSYTLTDDDVVVDKGVIISCSYDFTASMIIIPDTLDGQIVIGIGHYVFKGKGITNITLPAKLKFVGYGAFRENILSEITIPATTDSIAAYAFFGNYIKNILYEENSVIRVIGSNAFRLNRIDSLIIPNTIERIESEAFEDTKIKYLAFEVGSQLTFLGNHAFAFNNIQNDITIPLLLKEIGNYAFQYNPIGHVYLHNNVTDIGEGAFLGNNTTPTIDPLPTPEIIPFTTWFIRWRDSDNNTLYPGYVITDFTKGYRALIDQYLNVKVQVTDDNGFLLQGAAIHFSDSLMVTNALGKDSIAPVIRGVHNYVVSASGCLTVSASVDVQDDTFLQVILKRLYGFTVKVIDNNNKPIQNANIVIGDSILQSNTQGSANMKLIDGIYTCSASIPGYSIGSTDFVIHDADTSITMQLKPSVITYYPNGGIEGPYFEMASGGSYRIQKNNFTKSGYSFVKWNTQADGLGLNLEEEADITLEPGDFNLYAVWQIDNYQITYDLRGGHNDPQNPNSYTINTNNINLKPAIPTAITEPYFDGWFDSNGNKVETIPQGSTGNISLWASFIAKPTYLINYQNTMNGSHSNPINYSQYDLPIILQNATQNGYNFMGWYSDKNFTNKISSLAAESTGDTILYASWEAISYSIQYVLNNGTNSPLNPASYTIENKNITLQAATREGYTFEGWFADESFSQPAASVPSGSFGDKTFYAKWKSSFLLIFEITTDGTTTAQDVSVIVNNNIHLVSGEDGVVQYVCENHFQYTYKVELDNIEITSGTVTIQGADQLIKVEIVNAYMRWYDVIFCDNANHLWTAFEWQKSGQTISNEQFYHKEGGIENGSYTLVVTSPSGKKFTWTQYYQNNNFEISYYPNPVMKSNELTIEVKGLDDFQNCELLIYTPSGQIVKKISQVDASNQVQLNSNVKEGVYLLVLSKQGKQLLAKQLIVR